MKIVKIESSSIRDFSNKYDRILLEIGSTYNIYLVQDDCEYSEIQNIPSISGVIEPTMDAIIKYVSNKSNEQLEQDIINLNTKISESDYKIIKSYEYSLIGKELEYNIEELHNERQTIRDLINEKQSQIKDMKTWEELSNIVLTPN